MLTAALLTVAKTGDNPDAHNRGVIKKLWGRIHQETPLNIELEINNERL
jgi:hypothetical protein